MNKVITIITIILVTAWHSYAAPNYEQQWKMGNDFYAQKQYDSAAYYFEQLASLKPKNAEVYYNLGNTYYRLNRIGPAVLNYERALNINPEYKEAKDNLTLARARIVSPIPEAKDIFFVSWWNSLTHPNKTTMWAVTALLCFVLILALSLARRLNTAGKNVPVQLQGFLGFACVFFLILAFSAARKGVSSGAAVVMLNDSPLMNATLKGKPISYIPEGTTVKITDQNGGWAEVTLPDGRTGWLQQSTLTGI
jgi:hypothetical protein